MPRRIYTYPDLPGWGWMNMVSTIGAFLMAAASLLFVWNLAAEPPARQARRRQPLERLDAGMGGHLAAARMRISDELPPIRSRRPLWDDANPDRPDPDGRHEMAGGNHSRRRRTRPPSSAFIISESGFLRRC